MRMWVVAGAVLALVWAAPANAASPVTFDSFSMKVNGKRVFLNGGEAHYFRMPSQKMWPEVLGKMRAAGLNHLSIYVPWQLHEPEPGRFRFDGRLDFERFLRIARDEGLYVVVRPGPYIQGEIDGGGYPSWLLGGRGVPRTTDPPFRAAWRRWFATVMPRIARWQVGGRARGSVVGVQVENEFPGDTPQALEYMRDLTAEAKRLGITVPVTHNDVQFLGTGISPGRYEDIVDVPGFDNYPRQFTCCPEWNEATFSQVDTFEEHYRSEGYTHGPLYTPEIQGGTAPFTGDDGKTLEERYRSFVDYDTVQSLSLYGQGLTFVNRYMLHGGTTWGNLTIPPLGTTYDYAASIREWGGLGPRYDDLRRVGLQTRVAARSLAASSRVTGRVTASSSLYAVRRSSVDGALHVFLRNADPGPGRTVSLKVDGRDLLPVFVPGHGARWLVAGLAAAGWKIDVSTAEVALASKRNLALFGDRGKRYEAIIGGRRFEFTPTRKVQYRRFGPGRRLILLDRAAAARLWVARRRVWIGPSLVTRSSVETDRRRRITVIGSRRRRSVILSGPSRRLRLPALRGWRLREGTPERSPTFDDSGWRRATRASTSNFMQPLTRPILAADDNGYVGAGFIWYRGRFDGAAAGMCIEGRHRFHVWLNGGSLGTYETPVGEVDLPSIPSGVGAQPPQSDPKQIRFPAGAAGAGTNVISVLVESYGHSMDAGAAAQAKNSRGLISASLDRGAGAPPCGFAVGTGGEINGALGNGPTTVLPPAPNVDGGIEWRLRGGDAYTYPNTSGLDGEARGWHQRTFDDGGWTRVALPSRLALGPGQMAWLRSRFRLRIPRGTRAPLALDLPRSAQPSEVYVNGVHIARAGRDREQRFAIPPGVISPRGENTIAIARWNVAGTLDMPRPRLMAYPTSRSRPIAKVLRALAKRR